MTGDDRTRKPGVELPGVRGNSGASSGCATEAVGGGAAPSLQCSASAAVRLATYGRADTGRERSTRVGDSPPRERTQTRAPLEISAPRSRRRAARLRGMTIAAGFVLRGLVRPPPAPAGAPQG